PRLRGRTGLVVAREDRSVWSDDAVAAARPHHRDLIDRFLVALAVLEQHAAEGLVGEDAGEVIDPAISLGFTDNSNDVVGFEQAVGDALFKAGGVRHRLQFDFENFNRHSFLALGWRGAPVQALRPDQMPRNSSIVETSPKKRSMLRTVISCSSFE